MTRRMLAILIFSAVCSQALLGGFRTGISLCFGSEIEHTHSCEGDVHTHICEHHDSTFPTPILPDDERHPKDCPCTDVEIDPADLIITSRDITPDIPSPEFAPPAAIDWPALLKPDNSAWHPPPPHPPGDLRADSSMAIVRATRLLI